MNLRTLLLAVPLAAALPAQTTPPAVVPHVLVDTVGPDGWRLRLGPTNLGSMLESEQGRALWQPPISQLLGGWQQFLGADDGAFAPVRARALGYSGRVRIGYHYDSAREHGANRIGIVLDGDGRTDLDALAQDLKELQYRLVPGEWQEVEVLGTKVTVRGEGDQTMAPLREGGHLLVALATSGDIEGALQIARSLAAECTGKPPAPNTPALRVRFDFAALLQLSMQDDAEAAIWQRALGMTSLGEGTLSLATAGPHVLLEFAQQFTSDERGMFGAFFPASQGLPSLLRTVRPGGHAWKVGHFDAVALYRAILRGLNEDEKKTEAEVRATIQQEIGIDLHDDLLAHLTDEVMLTGTIPERSIEQTTWSLTFRLRDEAAFRTALQKMLPKLRPTLQREAVEKRGDVEVFRYGTFGEDVWLAAGNMVFVLAGGRDAEEQIGAVLDAAMALREGEPAAPTPPADFAPLQRFLPPGTNGLALGDFTAVLALPSELWLGLLAEFTPLDRPRDAELDPEQQEQALALLRAHKLDVLRSATGFTDRTWRWRLFW
ncbi:MAG: hypothetical protein FJ265_03945 [Planctomycetes bacterium]|nr:hypothetical protein [Planctomycetota bacterium]